MSGLWTCAKFSISFSNVRRPTLQTLYETIVRRARCVRDNVLNDQIINPRSSSPSDNGTIKYNSSASGPIQLVEQSNWTRRAIHSIRPMPSRHTAGGRQYNPTFSTNKFWSFHWYSFSLYYCVYTRRAIYLFHHIHLGSNHVQKSLTFSKCGKVLLDSHQSKAPRHFIPCPLMNSCVDFHSEPRRFFNPIQINLRLALFEFNQDST